LPPNQFDECMGLNCKLPHDDVSNPVDVSNPHEEATVELHELLRNIDWDSLEDDAKEEAEVEAEPDEDELNFNDDPVDFHEEEADLAIDEQVEQMHLLASETKSPESSMQSFSRLTNEQPWVPFRKTNAATPKITLDLEEEGLFNCPHKDCKRHVSPGTPRCGCRDFELTWNVEVAERHRKRIEDDTEEIVLINGKSYMQLQEHCDDIMESERMSEICDPNCPRLRQLNTTTMQTRQQVGPPTGRMAEAIQCRNAGLSTPFGAPTAFNSDVAGHAIIGHNTGQQAVPWHLAVPEKRS